MAVAALVLIALPAVSQGLQVRQGLEVTQGIELYRTGKYEECRQLCHQAIEGGYWFLFYHDAVYRALKWDEAGKVTESVERERR